ncbi:MAG: hypothetical protein MHM6MM_001484 [Cercozoa sp. M6MM]
MSSDEDGRLPLAAHAACGFAAGCVATVAVYPLDLLKVRFQNFAEHKGVKTKCEPPKAQRPVNYSYNSVRDVWKTVRAEGIGRAMYAGVGVSVLGSSTAWASFFLVFEALKRAMRGDTAERLSDAHHFVASLLAGVVTVVMTNPIWVLKTNLQLQKDNRFRGIFDTAKQLVHKGGVRSLYRGLTPSLLGVSHGAFKFMFYERLRYEVQQHTGREVLTDLETLAVTSVSKILASALTYPHQVLRTHMQRTSASGEHSGEGLWSTAKRVWHVGGIRGLYRGWLASTARVVPGACITLITYERLKLMLQ